MFFTIISYVAAVLTTLSFLPQAIKTVKTRDTSSISFRMYLLFTIGVICWMIYGIATVQWSIILSNAVTAIFAFIILSFKIAGLRAEKKTSGL